MAFLNFCQTKHHFNNNCFDRPVVDKSIEAVYWSFGLMFVLGCHAYTENVVLSKLAYW